jgi:hypothetical protein
MGTYTEKTEITHADFLKLQGLLVIGNRHYKIVDSVTRCISEILGEDYDNRGGHASDAVWEGYSAEELLRKSEITVIPPPADDELRKLAELIAGDLFVNGNNEQAERLKIELDEGRYGGGWSREAVIDRVLRILQSNR